MISNTLELQDMIKGDWYSWDASDWSMWGLEYPNENLTYKVTNESINSVCSTDASKYEFFPNFNEFHANHKLCKLFGGESANTSTSAQVNEAIRYVKSLCYNGNFQCSNQWFGVTFYTRYYDIEKFNEWVDFETNKKSLERIDWNYGEPNGGDFENCAQVIYSWGRDIGKHNDLPCAWAIPTLCEDIGKIILTLRGLCAGTIYDTKYLMKTAATHNGKRYFTGNFGWKHG